MSLSRFLSRLARTGAFHVAHAVVALPVMIVTVLLMPTDDDADAAPLSMLPYLRVATLREIRDVMPDIVLPPAWDCSTYKKPCFHDGPGFAKVRSEIR